jgi:type II secretory pathway component PulF
MKYRYQAFEKSGKAVGGVVDAVTVEEARDLLRRQDLFVTDVRSAEEAAAPGAVSRRRPAKVGAGARLRFVATFARQLNVLVASGTPLVQALGAIERQMINPRWREVVAAVRERVETGTPVAEAMGARPEYFDAICRSLVAAGESSGTLGAMLERLATLARKQLHLRSAITGALVYPSLLMALGVNVVLVMMLFVLPRFSGLFESLDSPLPPTTKCLLAVSEALRSHGLYALGGLGVAAFALWHWLARGSGGATVAVLSLRAPKVGLILRNLTTARIARMLGVLLESRVPLLDALGLTCETAVHPAYRALIERAKDAVTRGESVSSVLGQSDLINPAVQEALRTGEQSGRLGEPLVQMADFLDEENEVVVKALTTLLEPAILIVLGLIVGLMALSMFLPLFDLVSAASGGAK